MAAPTVRADGPPAELAATAGRVATRGPRRLSVAIFTTGAATMALELVGSRALAPFVGSSTVVWSCLIGVVLASLSLGYRWGGALADREPSERKLAGIVALAGALAVATAAVHRPLLDAAVRLVVDVEAAALVGSVALLAVPSVLLGAVFPYAVRLRLERVASGGKTTGTLTAVSTVGSLVGTFLTGFVLVPQLGTTRSFLAIGVALLVASVLLVSSGWGRSREGVALVALGWVLVLPSAAGALPVTVETQYGTYRVSEGVERGTGRPVRYLVLGGGEVQSAVYTDGQGGLAAPYTRYYRLAKHFSPNLQRALMLGGGAYAYPADFLRSFATATLDVVEVDPGVTAVAERYFGLADDSRLTIYHEDARTFLNRAVGPYDAVFGDAFRSSYAPPFHLTTVEAARRVHAALRDGGVAIFNVISALEGSAGQMFRAELATLRQVFPYVYVLPVSYPADGQRLQNVALVAFRGAEPPLTSDDPELAGYLSHRWLGTLADDVPPLTDDLAPVEAYARRALRFSR